MIGPPTLPPKSLSLRLFLGRPIGVVDPAIGIELSFCKLSKARPWKEFEPRRVTKFTCISVAPKPVPKSS